MVSKTSRTVWRVFGDQVIQKPLQLDIHASLCVPICLILS